MHKVQQIKQTVADKCPNASFNVRDALETYILWLSNDPGDYKGAIKIAGDSLCSESEVDEFESCLKLIAT